jgi:hypothetical protein
LRSRPRGDRRRRDAVRAILRPARCRRERRWRRRTCGVRPRAHTTPGGTAVRTTTGLARRTAAPRRSGGPSAMPTRASAIKTGVRLVSEVRRQERERSRSPPTPRLQRGRQAGASAGAAPSVSARRSSTAGRGSIRGQSRPVFTSGSRAFPRARRA